MSGPQHLLWLPLGVLLLLEFNFAQELPPPEVGPNGKDGGLPGERSTVDVTKVAGKTASAPYYQSSEPHLGSSQVLQYVATSITPLQDDQLLPSKDSGLDSSAALDTNDQSTLNANQSTPEQPVAHDNLEEPKVTNQEEGGQQLPLQVTTKNEEIVVDTINLEDTNYINQTRTSSTDENTNINARGQKQPTTTKEYSNNNQPPSHKLENLAGSPALTEKTANSNLDDIITENNVADKYPNQSAPELTVVAPGPPYQNASAATAAANNNSLDQIMSENSRSDKYSNQLTPRLTTTADNMTNRQSYGQVVASTELINNSTLDQINSETSETSENSHAEWNTTNRSNSHVRAAAGERQSLMEGRSLEGAADGAGLSDTNAVNNNTAAATQHLPTTNKYNNNNNKQSVKIETAVGGGDESKNATNKNTIMDNEVINESFKTLDSSTEVWLATQEPGEIVESIKETQIHDISKIIRYRVNDSLVPQQGSNNDTRWTSNMTGHHLDEVDWNKVALDLESKGIDSIQDDVNDLRTQFYVVAGIAGGLFLLLILLVLAVALSLSRMKDQLQHKDRRYIPQEAANARISRQPEPVNAYINSAFNGAQEMEERSVDPKTEINRLGYDVYNGRSSNVAAETSGGGAGEIPRAKVGEARNRDYGRDQPDHRHHLRLEDGVTPIGSRNGKTHGERRNERERY